MYYVMYIILAYSRVIQIINSSVLKQLGLLISLSLSSKTFHN